MKLAFITAIAVSLGAQQLPPPPDVTPATAKLEGSVTDALGHPLAGRVLTLDSKAGTLTAKTDAEGRYKFADLPVGTGALGSGTA
jgi:hypothetical protein